MKVVDIVILIIIALGALIGFKKGAIKSIVQLVGFVSIIIVAFTFHTYLGNVLIKYLPFFDYGGAYKGLFAINFLVYEAIAFIVIFILLYCILNILINLSGILDLLVKLTIVLELPSKIIGAVVGAIEGLMFAFLLSFIMIQIGPTQKLIVKSSVANEILISSPVLNKTCSAYVNASKQIYEQVEQAKDMEDKTEANKSIIRTLGMDGIVSDSAVQDAINKGKIPGLENVTFIFGVSSKK